MSKAIIGYEQVSCSPTRNGFYGLIRGQRVTRLVPVSSSYNTKTDIDCIALVTASANHILARHPHLYQ